MSSEVSSDVSLGEGRRSRGWLSGRVSSEVSSDVCLGEGRRSRGLLEGFV